MVTMKHAEHSPCFVALGSILHEHLASTLAESTTKQAAWTDMVLFDYRDPATFSELWLRGLKDGWVEVDGERIELANQNRTIVVTGNDPPNGVFEPARYGLTKVDFSSHFTASSWLAAFMLKWNWEAMAEEGKSPNRTGRAFPRIAILDPRPAGSGASVAQALQLIFSARNAAGQPVVPGTSILNGPSLTEICEWLSDNNKHYFDAPSQPPGCSESVFALLRSTLWNDLISEREQHHALSNVIGAFLLQADGEHGIPDRSATELHAYLSVLLASCGVTWSAGWPGTGAWIGESLREKIDGVVLIDDMAEIWQRFLSVAWAGVPKGVHTAGVGRFTEAMEGSEASRVGDSLTGLPKRLHDFLESRRARLTCGDLIPTEGNTAATTLEHFVLFLDLRLGLSDRFHQQLRKVGNALLSSDRNLPWLTAETRTMLLKDLESGETTTTLLPRLLSLLDPTLPILIFSSTHRSELIDPFRDYGNIITTFRKPMLSSLNDDWTSIAGGLRADFAAAVERAAHILTVRRLLLNMSGG